MLIAFSGKMASGKTLSARLLYNMFKDSKFNPKLKSIAKPVYEVTSIITSQPIGFVQDNKSSKSKYNLTYREILQHIGTSFREQFSKEIWLDILFSDNYDPRKDIIIIDDLRFQNEVDYLKKTVKCFFARVERFEKPIDTDIVKNIIKEYGNKNIESSHPSEVDLDNYGVWDTVINNKTDIESLVLKLNKNIYDPVVNSIKQ